MTAGTLERWLEKISSHELIQTDRAHVMIAAALLGKTVEFDTSSYFKVTALADYALDGFPIRATCRRRRRPGEPPSTWRRRPVPLKATAVRKQLIALAETNPPPPGRGDPRSLRRPA